MKEHGKRLLSGGRNLVQVYYRLSRIQALWPPRFDRNPWVRIDPWCLELSTPWVVLHLSAYKVRWWFNILLLADNLQGDLLAFLAINIAKRGIKFEFSLPNLYTRHPSTPIFDWRIFYPK